MLLREYHHDCFDRPSRLSAILQRRQHRTLRRRLPPLRLVPRQVQIQCSRFDKHGHLRKHLSNRRCRSRSHQHRISRLLRRDQRLARPHRVLPLRLKHEHRPLRAKGASPEPAILRPRIRLAVPGRQRPQPSLHLDRHHKVQHELRRQLDADLRRLQRNQLVQQHAMDQALQSEPRQRAQPAKLPVRLRRLLHGRYWRTRPWLNSQPRQRRHACVRDPYRRSVLGVLLLQGLYLDGRRERQSLLLQCRWADQFCCSGA